LFPSSGETTQHSQLGPFESTNLNLVNPANEVVWFRHITEAGPVSEASCVSEFCKLIDEGKYPRICVQNTFKLSLTVATLVA
jgi:hypothetical protein